SATLPAPLPQTQLQVQTSSQLHTQSASYLHLQPFAATYPRYAAGSPTFARRSSVQQLHLHTHPHPHLHLHPHMLPSRNRSYSSEILPVENYGQVTSPDTISTTIAPSRSPPRYSPSLPSHSVAYTLPATAHSASVDSSADADVSGLSKMAFQTRFLASDNTYTSYYQQQTQQQSTQQRHDLCFETGMPAFTPVSATSAYIPAGSTEVAGTLMRPSNSPYSQQAPELTPDSAYNRPDGQHLVSSRASYAFPLVGRRNTVSSYQGADCSYADDAGTSSAGHIPLSDCSAVASPPPSGHYSRVAEARSRYMSKMPASGYHCHHIHAHIHSHSHSDSHEHRSGSSAAVSSDSMQVQSAIPTCKSAISDAPLSGREVRLPSIQAILAEATSESTGHDTGSSSGSSGSVQTSVRKANHRLRSYTSPPSAHAETQPLTDTSSAHVDTRAEAAARVSHPSSPHAQCYQDSQIIEAKMGIDVLATAAISVSSVKNSISLPHLTPLSEFALRNAAQQQQQQQQQHCLTAPASPRQSQDERQSLPSTSSSKSKDGVCSETRSQQVTPTHSREKTPHGWRPW
ncbi:hypothetical protein J3B02_001303, partial [Coemansia erecta]